MDQERMPKVIAIIIVTVIFTLGLVSAFFFMFKEKEQISPLTPTPTPTVTAQPSQTVIPSITITETPSVTPTTTSTPVPTSVIPTPTTETLIKKSYSLLYDPGSQVQGIKITVELPESVVATKVSTGNWNGYVLKKGTKNFMFFNSPTELYEQQGYTSATPVDSSISNLRRVRARKVFDSSGVYKFAVAYVLASDLRSGTSCTAPGEIGNPTTSPCASPALTYKLNANESVWFSAYCSIDPIYQAICDRAMKTILVEKL